MKFKTLIYIASIGDAVFDSQVVFFLKSISDTKFFDRIVLLAGVKKDHVWMEELSALLTSDFQVILYQQFPNYSFYYRKQRTELCSTINRILTNNSIIHLRGESLTGIIRNIIDKKDYENVKIVTDIRGVAIEEMKIYLRKKINPIKYQLKLYHYIKCLKNASIKSDYISCVSEALCKKIVKETGINTESIGVNHCSAGNDFNYSQEKRRHYRKKLGISEETILIAFSTSGNGLYQNTFDIIRICSAKGYKILNLSKTKIEDYNVINLFVPFQEVSSYLCSADIGIIWRNDDIVNNVASPVKFSEYVCCGLPIITSNGVHLINDYITKTGFGKIILKLEDVNESIINYLLTLDREKISTIAQSNFSSNVIIPRYINIYKKLFKIN